MRPNYSSALRDLLEDVVESSTRHAPTVLDGPKRPWRSLAVTATVATSVIVLSAVVITNNVNRPGAGAVASTAPVATPSPTGSSRPGSAVYLGLVSWTQPEATSNPTSTIYITEDWDPFRDKPGTCGIAFATPVAQISPSGTVTIAIRGYGYRVAPGTPCTLQRSTPEPVAVHLSARTQVLGVTDPATKTTIPLTIAPHPDWVRGIRATPTLGAATR